LRGVPRENIDRRTGTRGVSVVESVVGHRPLIIGRFFPDEPYVLPSRQSTSFDEEGTPKPDPEPEPFTFKFKFKFTSGPKCGINLDVVPVLFR
jgi:hypothetical protein